jgi:hypothetical protein
MTQVIKSGTGWRLGWNPDFTEFQGLVGGDDWAFELTSTELEDFCRLLLQLAHTMQQMASELMDEEQLHCEAESDLLWLEAAGYPQRYSVRLILHAGRRSEGFWPETAVPDLVQAAQMIGFF